MAEIKLTKDNFETEVLNSDVPVIVDFWAQWCGPCKMLSPVISQLADEFEGRIKVGKVNVDEEQELSAKYGIMSIPMVALFENGEVKTSSVGFRSKEQLKSVLGLD